MAQKIEKIPGVTAVVPGEHAASSSGSPWRSMHGPAGRRPTSAPTLNDIAQQIRAITREYAYARPGVSFPNALGGRDTFAPIRASCSAPTSASWRRSARDC